MVNAEVAEKTESKEITTPHFFDMSLPEQVDWILNQPVAIKKRFLKTKSIAEIESLPEEKMRSFFSELLKVTPKGTLRSILIEFPDIASLRTGK